MTDRTDRITHLVAELGQQRIADALAPGGAVQAPLTDAQITAGAAILGDNGQPVGRNTAIMVFDAMTGAAQDGPLPNEPKPCRACDPSVNYVCEEHGEPDSPAQVIGGKKPYTFSWSHPSPDLAAISELARNAARYTAWRDAMLTQDQKFIDAMALALPPAVGHSREPTADEWDAAVDKAAALPELVAVRVIGDAMEPAPADRKAVLLKAAYDLLRKQAWTSEVINLLHEEVHYDGTNCDGLCLISDIEDELGIDGDERPA